jgi:hypothetical protein
VAGKLSYVKVLCIHTMKVYGEMECIVTHMRKRSQYPLQMGLDEPQRQSGHFEGEKIHLPLPRNPTTVL